MTGVITGDIISSSSVSPEQWIGVLKNALSYVTESKKHKWEIYRGDSFQLEVKNYLDCFKTAIYIKACIKTIKGLDVRMGIGIGEKSYEGDRITEFNGTAFEYSGKAFDLLKKRKTNLLISLWHTSLESELNLYFKLGLIAMDNWSVKTAQTVKILLENPEDIQQELAKKLNISQDAVSKRIKRAYLDEILELDFIYKQKITQIKTLT